MAKNFFLTAKEVDKLIAAGEEKRQERLKRKNETPKPNEPAFYEFQKVTKDIIERLKNCPEVQEIINGRKVYSKANFLDLTYQLIVQKDGKIKDGGVRRIMSFFDVNEFSNQHLRKRYIMCICAAFRQRQVAIKDKMAKFVTLLFKSGYPECSIVFSMLEGEYVSLKTYDILNDDEIAQILIDADMGGLIIPRLKSIINNGGYVCAWTKNFTPATDVKLSKISELLEKYESLKNLANPRVMLGDGE